MLKETPTIPEWPQLKIEPTTFGLEGRCPDHQAMLAHLQHIYIHTDRPTHTPMHAYTLVYIPWLDIPTFFWHIKIWISGIVQIKYASVQLNIVWAIKHTLSIFNTSKLYISKPAVRKYINLLELLITPYLILFPIIHQIFDPLLHSLMQYYTHRTFKMS